MKIQATALAVAGALLIVASAVAQTAPASQPAEVSLRVQSVRLGRLNEIQRAFRNRGFSDGSSPGVSITLLMRFEQASVLPLTREAISIDTFVDDTYQSLLGSAREGYSSSPSSPTVSDDGKMVLFTVQSNRSLADDAGRVFVRGKLDARIASGAVKTGTGVIAMAVGKEADVGPFRASIRSITETSRGALSTQLNISGDAARIRKVRVLGPDGAALNADGEVHVLNLESIRGASATVSVPAGRTEVTLEFTYAEKIDNARVPFEAQVDLGVTKAGPIGEAGGAPRRGAEPQMRVWPPPPVEEQARDQLPRRRAPFNPPTQPAPEAIKLERAAVDLFSLTIGKPAPGEVASVRWSNPPASTFRAAGFTIARLMLTTPGVRIIRVPYDGVSIERFEDDTGAKLSTSQYRQDVRLSPSGATPLALSSTGEQALVTVSLASSPTPGATRCTMGGNVRATVGKNSKVDRAPKVTLTGRQSVTCGPFSVTLTAVRQPPPLQPGQTPGAAEVSVLIAGPLDRIRSIDLLDAVTLESVTARPMNLEGSFRSDLQSPTATSLHLRPDTRAEHVIVEVSAYDSVSEVDIPFELTSTIGL